MSTIITTLLEKFGPTILPMIVKLLLEKVSPHIRENLKGFLDKLWIMAESTPNPLDNVAMALLYTLLGFDSPMKSDAPEAPSEVRGPQDMNTVPFDARSIG